MNVLIIGSGGREHALAWKAAASRCVDGVYVAPGNAGTAMEPGVSNVAIDALDFDRLLDFARDKGIDLTIVGPEAPLVAGIVDCFRKEGLAIFGPDKRSAQLEGSKAFTKDFLARHNIPTAAYANFTGIEPARAWIREQGAPVVVKADGLAAGKGVILARTEEEAMAAVEDMLAGDAFGDAGHQVVIEEFLRGEEVSFIVMVDGENILPLASSQDHKARDDGDTGPNTGGMGACSPAPVVTPALHERIMKEVIIPTVKGLAAEGIRYSGFLYAGLMIAADGTPDVLEYNCRFGDPEAQPILMRLKSDFVALCRAGVEGRLNEVSAEWDSRAALGVVMTAGGYPGTYRKGDVIRGLANAGGARVFHAATLLEGDQVLTHGGRVLCVTALGDTIAQAQENAYKGVGAIDWQDCYYRNDIGHHAIAREQQDV